MAICGIWNRLKNRNGDVDNDDGDAAHEFCLQFDDDDELNGKNRVNMQPVSIFSGDGIGVSMQTFELQIGFMVDTGVADCAVAVTVVVVVIEFVAVTVIGLFFGELSSISKSIISKSKSSSCPNEQFSMSRSSCKFISIS